MSQAFTNIFRKIDKLLFNDDYVKAKEAAALEEQKNQPVATSTSEKVALPNLSQAQMTATASDEMVKKVQILVNSMNKPGIDFLELWNATEAMGEVNATTVTNAYVALKIASGNALSKDIIIQSGQAYINELTAALNNDVQQKLAEKENLERDFNLKLQNTNNEVEQLQTQILQLQQLLAQKKATLDALNKGIQPEVQMIEQKINSGKSAVHVVIGEMQQVLSLVQSNIKE